MHKRCLRIIYSDKISFEALLEKDSPVSIHNRNPQLLAIEIYKASKGLFPPITKELFEKKNEHQYNLRHNSQFTIPAVNSVYHGTESVETFYHRLKKLDSLGAFKTAIKSWKPGKCPCRPCRIYWQCRFYLRKPEFLQIRKGLNFSNFSFFFFSKKMM